MNLDTSAYRALLAGSASALPRGASVACDARARAAWTRKIATIVASGCASAARAQVRLYADEGHAREIAHGAAPRHIANAIAKALKRPALATARALTGRTMGRTPASRAWTEAARACARAWMRTEAPDVAWARALAVAMASARCTHAQEVGIDRITALARAGTDTIDTVDAAPQWLALEAVLNADAATLAKGPVAWQQTYVNRWRKALGLAPSEDGARCARALAGWRWPHTEPPGAMVALCLEQTPFANDVAWAHAVRQATRWRHWRTRVAKVGAQAAARAMRAGERDERPDVGAVLEREALKWARRRWGEDSAAALARARTAWGACATLDGSGEMAEPTLREDARASLEWAVPFTGPDALAAFVGWFSRTLDATTPEREIERWNDVAVTLSMEIDFGEVADRTDEGWVEPGERRAAKVREIFTRPSGSEARRGGSARANG